MQNLVDSGRLGVILLNFGGPASLTEVKRYLFNIFSDANIIPVRPKFVRVLLAKLIASRRYDKIARRLELIGGREPLVEITFRISVSLETLLRNTFPDCKVYVAMRYTPPFIEDALLMAKMDGVKRFVALTLYPQFCKVTTGSFINAFRGVQAKTIPGLPVVFADSYHNHKGYVSALVQKIGEVVSKIKDAPKRTKIVFSAHSIPEKLAYSDDPYLQQIKETSEAVARMLEMSDYTLAFQSAPRRKGWLLPSLGEVIEEAARAGYERIVVIPVSFTCDNMETLYDIDILAKSKTEEVGMEFFRVGCLNDSSVFISALSEIVLEKIRSKQI